MDSLTVSKLLSKMGTEAENKKALEADASRTSAYAPWYHLDSRVSSRRRPLEVPSHFCAVTGAPVVTYACAVGHATPRPCSPGPSAPRSHHRRLSVPYLPGYSSLHRFSHFEFSVPISFLFVKIPLHRKKNTYLVFRPNILYNGINLRQLFITRRFKMKELL